MPISVTSEATLKEKTANFNRNNCRPTLYSQMTKCTASFTSAVGQNSIVMNATLLITQTIETQQYSPKWSRGRQRNRWIDVVKYNMEDLRADLQKRRIAKRRSRELEHKVSK